MKLKKQIRLIVGMAIYIALYVVLSRFSINTGPYKITLSGLPLIMCGIMFGPWPAFTAGMIAGLLAQFLDGYGITPTTILWILPAGMRGLIVGFFMKNKKPSEHTTLLMMSIIISSIIVTLINTVGLYVDSKLYQYYSYAYVFGSFLARILLSVITSIVYCVLVPILILPFFEGTKKKKKSKENKERNTKMTTPENRRSLFNLNHRTKRLYIVKGNRDPKKGLVRRAN